MESEINKMQKGERLLAAFFAADARAQDEALDYLERLAKKYPSTKVASLVKEAPRASLSLVVSNLSN